ncbi:MAG: Na+/H+ antiporter subunit E [Sphingomonadales bacterium]
MIRRLLPHPTLTLTLAALWVLLANSFSAGSIVLGLALGVLIPLFTARFWPDKPPIRSWSAAGAYILIVLWDIAVANVQVAYWILTKRNDELNTRWIAIPLEVTSPEAITVLAGTITMTPGTVSADLSADGRCLLVHCLNAPDGDAAVAQIKSRYERRLREIFG